MRFELTDVAKYQNNIEKTLESFEEIAPIFEVYNISRDAAFIAFSNFIVGEIIDQIVAELLERADDEKKDGDEWKGDDV